MNRDATADTLYERHRATVSCAAAVVDGFRVADSLSPPDIHDRRRIGRSTAERRRSRIRLEGLWTELERERFVRIIREQRRDAEAVTITGAPEPKTSVDSTSAREQPSEANVHTCVGPEV
jgi:hypothetical protein